MDSFRLHQVAFCDHSLQYRLTGIIFQQKPPISKKKKKKKGCETRV